MNIFSKRKITINLDMVEKHQRIGYLLKELEKNPNDESILDEFKDLNFDHINRKFVTPGKPF